MKVAMITRDLNYGIGTHTHYLTKYLRELGVEVDIIEGKGDLRTSFKVPSKGYDIVHIQGSCFNIRRSKLPTALTIHTLIQTELQYTKGIRLIFGKRFEKMTINNADRIIVVSPILVDELLKHYGLYTNIVVIPNGVNTDEFNGNGERGSFFMTAGRDTPRKDFDIFRTACKLAKVDSVEFHGVPREKLIEGYETAKAFICSSLYETGPLTVLEAMAAKCPVICSNIPAIKDIIQEEYTGFLFEPGNANHLAWTIEAFNSSSKEHINSIVENALSLVKSKYGWDGIAKQTLKVYEELL